MPSPQSIEEDVVQTIDDLQRRADEGRRRVLGNPNFFERAEEFYNFMPGGAERVVYQPMVRVADLQMITLKEAGDLASPVPKFFIHRNGKRDKAREDAFRAQWKHFNYQLQWLFAQCHAGITGTCPIQVMFDPDRDRNRGGVLIRARNPKTYYPDPDAFEDHDREYVILEDYMSVREIADRFGPRAAAMVSLPLEAGGTYRIPRPEIDFPVANASLPPGPLQTMGPLGFGALSGSRHGHTSRIRVRSLFIKDSTRLPFTDELGYRMASMYNLLPQPDSIPAFPTGRLIVEAQRRLLYDGPNPYPGFPVFRLTQLPPLYGHWGVPPVRYTQDLQFLAEDLFSQAFENAYRMNNVMMFISRLSGLSPEDIVNLPGRVYFTDGAVGDKAAQIITNPAMPQHFIEYPKFLLGLQQELQGRGAARQGQGGAGNVGVQLFDSQVYQGQALTRVKAMMMADTMQRVAEFVFETAMLNLGTREFPVPMGSDLVSAIWTYDPTVAEYDYGIELDARSIRIDSATAMRNLALALARIGKIDDQTLMEWLDAPDPDEIHQRMVEQAIMAALQAATRKEAQGGRSAHR